MRSSSPPEEIASSSRWLVVSKPAGWLSVRPSVPGSEPVLADWLQEKYGKLWIVHRLDVGTSGVILFAKTAEDQRQASFWFHDHKIRKIYDLLAAGIPPAPVFRIREPVGGKPASTQVEVRERYGERAFLATACPRSGRRHQIRAHLAHQRCPILGDPEYGGPSVLASGGRRLEIPRVALHASRLELPTGEIFEAPPPGDFQSWVSVLREWAKAGESQKEGGSGDE